MTGTTRTARSIPAVTVAALTALVGVVGLTGCGTTTSTGAGSSTPRATTATATTTPSATTTPTGSATPAASAPTTPSTSVPAATTLARTAATPAAPGGDAEEGRWLAASEFHAMWLNSLSIGSTKDFRQTFTASCTACTELADVMDGYLAQGYRLDPMGADAALIYSGAPNTSVRATPPTYSLVISNKAYRLLDRAGKPAVTVRAQDYPYLFTLTRAGSRILVSGLRGAR